MIVFRCFIISSTHPPSGFYILYTKELSICPEKKINKDSDIVLL